MIYDIIYIVLWFWKLISQFQITYRFSFSKYINFVIYLIYIYVYNTCITE
jgi:hypothetical protein